MSLFQFHEMLAVGGVVPIAVFLGDFTVNEKISNVGGDNYWPAALPTHPDGSRRILI
jgi:hypothetical protein